MERFERVDRGHSKLVRSFRRQKAENFIGNRLGCDRVAKSAQRPQGFEPDLRLRRVERLDQNRHGFFILDCADEGDRAPPNRGIGLLLQDRSHRGCRRARPLAVDQKRIHRTESNGRVGIIESFHQGRHHQVGLITKRAQLSRRGLPTRRPDALQLPNLASSGTIVKNAVLHRQPRAGHRNHNRRD